MTGELKPCPVLRECPFCGGEARLDRYSHNDDQPEMAVDCEGSCQAIVIFPDIAAGDWSGLRTAWNTRTDTSGELLEAARKETQAVWRCAIGDVSGALDRLRNHWLNSKRKNDREAGAALSKINDLVWSIRSPAPSDYAAASAAGKRLHELVRAHIEGKN